MNEPQRETRRLSLDAGRTVILYPEGPAGGFPLAVTVDAVADGEHWFLGSIAPVRRGETVIVEFAAARDARYVTQATVSAVSPETFALRVEPVWERVQQRAFVRIWAHGLTVRVVRPTRPISDADLDVEPQSDLYDLLDVSAGGIRFASSDDFEVGEEVVCHFELPGSLCFVLPAHVVRAPQTPGSSEEKDSVGLEFAELEDEDRSQFLRWVYREQIRFHHESAVLDRKAKRLADLRSRARR